MLFLGLASVITACGLNTFLERGNKPIIQDVSSRTTEERLLQDDSFREINIKYDYSMIASNVSDAKRTYIEKTIFPDLDEKFKKSIKVKGPKNIPAFSNTGCDGDFTTPSSYGSGDTEADLIIFVKVENTEETLGQAGILAYAGPCVLSGDDQRPIVGMVVINEEIINVDIADMNNFEETIFHELLHIFAFVPPLYEFFPGYSQYFKDVPISTGAGSSTVIAVSTPKVVAWAKNHFNCDSVDHVLFENEGGSGSAGSHWEKSIFGNELMTSNTDGYTVMSGLTLAFLEDSGWYETNNDYEEDLWFGKGNGCDFLHHKANCDSTYKEYCQTSGEPTCTREYLAKASCRQDVYADGCNFVDYHLGHVCTNRYSFKKTVDGEENGVGSRCFHVDDGSPNVGCFKASCEGGNVVVTINGTQHTCDATGKKITAGGLELTCPDIKDFCNVLEDHCDDDCNGYGKCLADGDCDCDYFHKGGSCNSEQGCRKDDESICSQLKENFAGSSFIISLLGLLPIMLSLAN